MKKRINIFLIIFSIFISSIMGIDKVSGDNLWGDSFAPGIDNNTCQGDSCGSSGYKHYIVASGYRVSLVNSNGSTVKYNGVDTLSIDYWPKGDNFISKNICYRGFKYLTSECSGNNKHGRNFHRNGLQINYYSTKHSKNNIGTANKSQSSELIIGDTNKWDFITEDNLGIIQSKNGCTITNQITMTAGGSQGDKCYNNNYTKFTLQSFAEIILRDEHIESDYVKIGKLLYNAGFGTDLVVDSSSITTTEYKAIVSKSNSSAVYLVVEPVIAIARPDETGIEAVDAPIYVGTPAELGKMGFYGSTGQAYGWSFSLYSYLNPLVYAYGSGTVAGIKLSNTAPQATVANATDPSHSLGTYIFEIGKHFESDECAKIVNDYIGTGVTSETFKSDVMAQSGMEVHSDKVWLKQYDSYGLKDLTALKNYLNISGNEECPPPNCNYIAQKSITTNMTLDSYNSVITILKKLTGYPSTIPTGEVLKAEAYKENFITSNSNLCGTISCNDLLESLKNNNKLNVDNLNKLNKLFGEKYDLLKIENLKMLYGENKTESELLKNASCAKTPYCPVDSINASCNGNNSFTFKDTTETEDSCLKKGIAYNKSSSGTPILLQTSYDYDFGDGTPGDETNPPGYCEESVTFDFPTNVTNTVKAGTVFKWGLDDIEGENDLFGTMKVTRKCYLSKDLLNKSKNEIITIKSDWANVSNTGDGRINPLIKLTYSQAVESNKVIYNNTPLTVKLSKFDMQQNGFTDYNQVTYDELGNELPNADRDRGGDPRTMTCGGGGQACNSNPIVMTATYNIVYGNEFKWYSDKSNGDSLVKEEDREAGHINSYVYLGYGLPTSFLSSSLVVSSSDPAKANLCEPYGGPGNAASDKTENRGSMYVELSQIGTRNKDNNTYHFDNYVKANLVLDDDKDIGAHSDVFYSCTYQTRNSLFDNESGNGDLDNCTNTPPKGLDVVFRTVSLVNDDPTDIDDEIAVAFPGRVGNGRALGSNWEKINAVGTNGKNQILQILSNDVYDQEPLYEIELDVPLIQEIREANRNARDDGKDPYTDMTAVPPLTYYVALDEGYLGYVYTDTGGVYSGFLGHLSRQGELESVCLSGVVTTSHEDNCNQSWWLDTDKHTVTVE